MDTEETPEQRIRNGFMSALVAYVLWGFIPIYFIVIKDVDALEVLVHRILWAVPFGAAIIAVRGQWGEVKSVFRHRQMLTLLSVSAVVIAINWLVYIWAIQIDQIYQASLGYYINPLLFAVAGVFIFNEQLRGPQVLAVGVAAIGVLILTVAAGQLPTVALLIGGSFTIYGVIRKRVVIGGMPGLFVETIILLPFALAYLSWIEVQGTAVFFVDGMLISGILMLAGPLTAIPLLFFALAARRLSLATVGMMQFIAPSIQFVVGVIYGEPLTLAHIACFGCIWFAVAMFSWDAWRQSRRAIAAAV
jgi:chloramphenicol-sensitive protein RarD